MGDQAFTWNWLQPVGNCFDHAQRSRAVRPFFMTSTSRSLRAARAGLLKLISFSTDRTIAFGYQRERMLLNSGREPLAIRYRRRTQTAGDGPTSQRRRR